MTNCVKLYADDTKVMSKVNNSTDKLILQKDLQSAYEWSKSWLLEFNLLKCVVMHYGSNNPRHTYEMGPKTLSESSCERDLGVIFSSDLKWKQQVLSCSAKASSMLGRIKRSFVNFNVKLVKTLYTVYVRPLIEFAVPVWNPSLKGDIKHLESIQHRVTRMIPKLKKLPYNERLKKMGLTTLEARRIRGDLIQLFKIFNGLECINLCKKPMFKSEGITRGHEQRYAREICTYEPQQNFLTNRSANKWNELPVEAINAKTLNEFKAKIDKWMNG